MCARYSRSNARMSRSRAQRTTSASSSRVSVTTKASGAATRSTYVIGCLCDAGRRQKVETVRCARLLGTMLYPRFVSLLCVTALALTGAARLGAAQPTPAPRPNILFILSDDQGWADVGFHNGDL